MCALVFSAVIVLLGGALGGFVSFRRADKPAGGKVDAVLVGIAGGIVGVTFLTSLGLDFGNVVNQITGEGDEGFVTTTFKLLAIAVVGGYLGRPLLQVVGERLINARIDRVERGEQELAKENKFLDAKLKLTSHALQTEESIQEALSLLNELRDEDFKRRNVELLRAFALKRLGRFHDAVQAVDVAISIKRVPIALYNKACYLALSARDSEGEEDVRAVAEALNEAFERAKGAEEESGLREQIKVDLADTGDLSGLQGHRAIQNVLTKHGLAGN